MHHYFNRKHFSSALSSVAMMEAVCTSNDVTYILPSSRDFGYLLTPRATESIFHPYICEGARVVYPTKVKTVAHLLDASQRLANAENGGCRDLLHTRATRRLHSDHYRCRSKYRWTTCIEVMPSSTR